jgi:hypothetical protein
VALFMIALPAAVVKLWFSWRDVAPNQVNATQKKKKKKKSKDT